MGPKRGREGLVWLTGRRAKTTPALAPSGSWCLLILHVSSSLGYLGNPCHWKITICIKTLVFGRTGSVRETAQSGGDYASQPRCIEGPLAVLMCCMWEGSKGGTRRPYRGDGTAGLCCMGAADIGPVNPRTLIARITYLGG